MYHFNFLTNNFCFAHERMYLSIYYLTFVKFIFSKKATKIDKIFTVVLTLCSKCQINGEYCFNFCGLLRKHEL